MGLLKYFLLPMLFFLELEMLENGAFEIFSFTYAFFLGPRPIPSKDGTDKAADQGGTEQVSIKNTKYDIILKLKACVEK